MTCPPTRLDGATPLVRARKLAVAYRQALSEVDPVACGQVDAAARRWGEASWAMPSLVSYGLDDWLGASEAAGLASVNRNTLCLWRRRHRLVEGEDFRVCGRGNNGHDEYEYLAGSILAMSTEVRQRRKRGVKSER